VVAAQPDDTPDTMVVRVQTCLRAAKDRGRNRVVCEGDPEPSPELRVAFG
jgi:diguanylate cyclase